jgi:hypothetical protein
MLNGALFAVREPLVAVNVTLLAKALAPQFDHVATPALGDAVKESHDRVSLVLIDSVIDAE